MLHVKGLVFVCTISFVYGHGRLWDPPSRSSMFRKGFNTPANYNDNQLSCGGFAYQWGKNGGKCGICGDPYDAPVHENEAGGKYATGTISAHYTTGQTIDISVDVTANHLGWFEFRLCPNNDPKKEATQDCLDKYVLQLADGSGQRDYIDSLVGMRTRKWQLPAGLTCTQCVLQWKWHVGNSWGTDANGRGCLGCGPQEEFYGCADIAIEDPNGSLLLTTTTTVTSTAAPTNQPTTTTPTTTTSTTTTQPTSTTTPTTTTTSTTTTTTPTPTTTTTTTTSTIQPTTTVQNIQQTTQQPGNQSGNTYVGKKCEPTLVWKNVPGMDWWCRVNCRANYCPASHCFCT